MSIWDNVPENLKKSTSDFLGMVRTQAREIGDASVRHLERQDLLRERKQITARIGDLVVNRCNIEDKKTLRADAPDLEPLLTRVAEIDSRRAELDDNSSDDSVAKP